MAAVAATSSPNPQAHAHQHHSPYHSTSSSSSTTNANNYSRDDSANRPSSDSLPPSPSSPVPPLSSSMLNSELKDQQYTPSTSASASASASNTNHHHAGGPTASTTTGSISLHQDGTELSINANEFMDVLCGGCGLIINEDSADAGVIHFATQLWHVDCFRCAKCKQRVSTDRDDILLLSDGHPICGQCNYSCQICNLPILEEAIMTGDESYHASCFTCRSCNSRIEELVFAKTSQGIYCMPCHNERVARSRRHADGKRRARNKDGTRKTTTTTSKNTSDALKPSNDDATHPVIHSSTSPKPGAVSPSQSGHSTDSHLAAPSSDGHASSHNDTPRLSEELQMQQQQQERSRPLLASDSHSSVARSSSSNRELPPSPQLSPAFSNHTVTNTTTSSRPSGTLSPSLSPNPGRPGTATGGPTLRELREGLSSRSLRPTTADSSSKQSPLLPQSGSTPTSATPAARTNASPRIPHSPLTPNSAWGAGGSGNSRNNSSEYNRNLPATNGDRYRELKRRSSDPDTREVAEALKNLTTSGSAPQQLGRNSSSAVGLGIGGDDDGGNDAKDHQQEHSYTGSVDPDGSATPTHSGSKADLNHHAQVPLVARASSPAIEKDKRPSDVSTRPQIATPDLDFEEDYPIRTEVKRASKLDFSGTGANSSHPPPLAAATSSAGLIPPSKSNDGRLGISSLTPSFSFYDPDLMNLMDSFGQFDGVDGIQLSSPVGDRFSVDGDGVEGLDEPRGLRASSEGKTSKDSMDSTYPASLSSPRKSTSAIKQESDVVKSPSGSSIHTISAKMRESMKYASGGQVAMDTSFIETVLQELEDTKSRMKSLQSKYDRVKRASAHAAQGFSHAKTEFEQQVHAREEAELEMLVLRQKLSDQATKLTAFAKQERQQEMLATRSHNTRLSLEDMSKNLAKLTVERDMTAAEVAELIALQEGQHKAAGKDIAAEETTGKALQSRLSVRLDGVKARYRKEIADLTDQRNELLMEIEDLKQSRDVYLEETEALNTRNEELNVILSQLSSRVEALTAAETAGRSGTSATSSSNSNSTGSARGGFGFGFGGGKTKNHGGSPSISSTQENLLGSSSGHSVADSDTTASSFSRGGINLQSQAAAIARAEALSAAASANNAPQPAQAKKFKWMKPMAKSAGQGLASALPIGQSVPPLPPKNVPSSAPAIGGTHGLPPPQPHLQQQALIQQHIQQQQQQQHLQQQQQQREQSLDMIVREHNFAPFNVLRPTRCFSCQKNMWGQSEVRCSTCGQICHSKCLPSLTISCSQPYLRGDEGAPEPAGPSMFGRSLVEQALDESRDVPLIVEKCIQAVEANGMDYEGIYRKSGGTSQLKIITQLFERGQRFDLNDQNRFNDVSAITSVLKNYFRELPEPLLTYDLHERFIEASQKPEYRLDPGAREAKMKELISALPASHRETLRMLCAHLGRIANRAEENRMTARNLGVVFGPTLMRSADVSKEFSEMGQKSMTIEWLCEHSSIFDSQS
ncbi:unnamed protein product [Sympodiomycopsis kandeliae]